MKSKSTAVLGIFLMTAMIVACATPEERKQVGRSAGVGAGVGAATGLVLGAVTGDARLAAAGADRDLALRGE